ncbi:MAG TPA: hypothetical protein VE965_07390 [Gammaproteobacteria bacterium]|nr:hypothetical protein [Gammaproteobacteria bacterium]
MPANNLLKKKINIKATASANPLYGAALECGMALLEAAGYVF